MDGIINAFKPPGMSSHDLVHHGRKRLQLKRIGHAGTLDPGAAGVLLLLCGRATRVQDLLMQQPKTYIGELTFGLTTDTGDGFGEATEIDSPRGICPAHLEATLPAFLGPIQQIPPMASALKRDGVPLYRLARQGIEVARPPRRVTIYHLELLDWRGGRWPRALLEVTCSAGTYIRTLFQDLAIAMGSVGYMSYLSRTAVGSFRLDESVAPEQVSGDAVVPLVQALDFLPAITLSQEEALRVTQGQSPESRFVSEGDVCLLAPDGRLVALALPSHQDTLRLHKVFLTPEEFLRGDESL